MRKGFFARLAIQNIHKNRKIYYPYILTAVITVAMLYIITSLSCNPSLGNETVAFSLVLGTWVTSLFSVIFLFYTNSFLMKRRKKEFGLYNILGMEKKHIGRVVGWETLLILLLSLVIGFAVGMLLDKLMYLLFVKMLGSAANMDFYVSGYALVFTAALISGTFLLIFLNSLRQIHTAKPIELLHGGQVGEREPKAKWVLAVLGILTLGAGYFISIKVENPVAAIFLFFVAVVLVIIGTYLLFTAGSISVLKLMRKSKKYYYRADHFINTSGMIYRMKQNAVGLGNVCILSTMVLVMVFSTVALWFGIEDSLDVRCPSDVVLETHEHERGDELAAEVAKHAKATGRETTLRQTYRYLSIAAYKQGDTYSTSLDDASEMDLLGNDICSLFFLPLSDYNALFGKSETLEADEILLNARTGFINSGEHTGDTLSVFDDTFRIKARFDNNLENGMVVASVYNTYFIVVKDMDVIHELDVKQREVYGRNHSNVTLYYGFDVDGTDEQTGALFADIRTDLRAGFDSSMFAECRPNMRSDYMELYGGLLFIGLFLGMLFTMAMILIIYYKQISEGYDDQERYHIMRKVGLSQAEIKRSIGSQILTVFFLPLVTAGVHVAFSFPAISKMFRALGMFNTTLEALCAAVAFVLFAVLYGVVYVLTARVYYRIISAR